MSRLKLAAIACLLIGPFMIVMNFLETKEKKQIEKDGVETVAAVMGGTEKRGRKGRRSYEFDVQYQVGTSTQSAQVPVSKERFEAMNATPVLQIKYLKDNPSKLIVVGDQIEHPELTYIGAGLFVFGLVGCWWLFLRKKPEEALPAPAEGA